MERNFTKSQFFRLLFLLILSSMLIACGEQSPQSGGGSQSLNRILEKAGVNQNTYQPVTNPAKVTLGKMLFFDKVLSGNRDISCATCHHPLMNTVDNVPLSLGTGNEGLGPTRTLSADRILIPRNSPELFNRGHPEWETMFWDGRISGNAFIGFSTPANEQLLPGLDNILAAQALFPVTSRDEMRGLPGDRDAFGRINEIALIDDSDFMGIWSAVFQRIWSIPEYQTLLRQAYPGVPDNAFSLGHIANAIAEFEINSFTFFDSPFDRFLAGDQSALSNAAKQGAVLFFEKAGCDTCHSGILLTDQQYYNLGVPQLGPGKDFAAPLDWGRLIETSLAEDKYRFRTPSLRNVATTGPYMHNGAYDNLRDAVVHHLNASQMLFSYNGTNLPQMVASTVKSDMSTISDVLATLDSYAVTPPVLTEAEIDTLVEFLVALTDLSSLNLIDVVPESVPSGLPVAD